MKKVVFALFVLTLSTSPSWAAGLKLTIHDGRVSLDAQEVTLRQILTEWARVGKTRVVNLERLTSGPLTLRFDNVPEPQALEIVLRSVPGYMAAPRASLVADESIYDRILIMATTTAVAARPVMPTFSTPQQPSPNVTQLRPPAPPLLNPGVLPEPNDDPNDDPAIAAAAAAGLITVPAPPVSGATTLDPSGVRPPLFGPPSQPSPPQNPAAPSTPSNPWNAPVGASQPGLATPSPPPASTPSRVGSPRPPQADR